MRRRIGVIDTTLRDAHQCLWATRMRTAHILPVLDRFDRAGFDSVDLMGAIQFDVCLRYLRIRGSGCGLRIAARRTRAFAR